MTTKRNIYKDAEHPFAQFIRIVGKGKNGARSLSYDEAYQAFSMILKNEVLDELVAKFYKREFWDKMFGDSITDQQVAQLMFDTKVNQTGGFNFLMSNALNKSGKTKYFYYEI